MNRKVIGIVLLVLGAVLLFFGWNATDSAVEQISEGLTGRYTDETMYYLIGGGVCAAAGLGVLLFGRK